MEDLPISLETSQTSLLKRGGSYSAERASSTSRVHLLRGRSAVAAMSEMLDQLSRRTAQAGAMHWLQYSLDTPTAMQKIPILLLVGLDPGVVFPEQNFLGHALRDQHLRWSRSAADATSIFTAPTTVSDVHDLLELENAAGDVDHLAGDILRA